MPKLVGKKQLKSNAEKNGREVVYPEYKSQWCFAAAAITVEVAKKLLGWQEVDPKSIDYHITDVNGKKVKLCHNITNRPIYPSIIATLKQEHLRKRWLMNGEPIIVGQTGLILNGQHTLIALIFASQEWDNDRDSYPDWESAPTMEKLVVFGIDEGNAVVNTMDTCKPRTLAEALYRSDFFSELPKNGTGEKERRMICRTLDYAVKMLWHRTNADENPFAPRRTHSEALAFISKHPKILDAVKHIWEEEGSEKNVTRWLSTGYAAGMLYLMACCKTEDTQAYYDNPSEDALDFSMWDEACDFWVKLAGSDASLKPVRDSIIKMVNSGGGSRQERTAVISKAWICLGHEKPITAKSIALEYSEEDGFRCLTDNSTVGGIDSVDRTHTATIDPTAEEIEDAAAEIKKEREAKKLNGKSASKKKSKVEPIEAGTRVYVLEEEGGGTWTGIVTECYQGPTGMIAKVKTSTKKVFEEPIENCLLENPEAGG